jgi:uncharacterized membrane protein YccF (DUF307 family)
MKTLLNIIWVVLAGAWLAIAYVVVAFISVLLIVTIPLVVPAMRMAGYVFWPFGRTVVRAPTAGAGSKVANVVWAVLLGWILALVHIVTAVLCAITIIGIPLAIVNMKLIPLAFAPYGKRVVPEDQAFTGPAPAVVAAS